MRSGFVALVWIAVLAGGAAAAVPPYDFTRPHPTEDTFNQSIQVYQDALRANPNDGAATYWLGMAYWETSVYYRDGEIKYGADYLDRAITTLERAVAIDDKNLAAWQTLVGAYYTRGAPGSPWSSPPAPSDFDKSYEAAYKVLELSRDPSAANRGVPRPGAHNGEVTTTYVPLPDRNVRFHAGDLLVVADPETKLVYHFPCASLPAIQRPQIFLSKWEAFQRGYRAATVCPPP